MNRYIVWLWMCSVMLLHAEVTHLWADEAFLEKNITIIDIRTPTEWEDKGVVYGSHLLTFFEENGEFNVSNFKVKLENIVEKEQPFALLCRVGKRSRIVADFLSKTFHFHVINLKGGIMHLIYKGYATKAYQKMPKKLKLD